MALQVRLNILSNLGPLTKVVGVDLVVSSVVPTIIALSADPQWRVREAVAAKMPLLAEVVVRANAGLVASFACLVMLVLLCYLLFPFAPHPPDATMCAPRFAVLLYRAPLSLSPSCWRSSLHTFTTPLAPCAALPVQLWSSSAPPLALTGASPHMSPTHTHHRHAHTHTHTPNSDLTPNLLCVYSGCGLWVFAHQVQDSACA